MAQSLLARVRAGRQLARASFVKLEAGLRSTNPEADQWCAVQHRPIDWQAAIESPGAPTQL